MRIIKRLEGRASGIRRRLAEDTSLGESIVEDLTAAGVTGDDADKQIRNAMKAGIVAGELLAPVSDESWTVVTIDTDGGCEVVVDGNRLEAAE